MKTRINWTATIFNSTTDFIARILITYVRVSSQTVLEYLYIDFKTNIFETSGGKKIFLDRDR